MSYQVLVKDGNLISVDWYNVTYNLLILKVEAFLEV